MTAAVLVVTNRPEHIPWWLHQIRKQTRPPDQVVVVSNYHDKVYFHAKLDAYAVDYEFPLTVMSVYRETTLGELRQMALDTATTDVILWFDDDDWYHPERVEASAGLIESGRYDVAVLPLTHFYYLKEQITRPFPYGTGMHLPATAWRREIGQRVRFEAVNTGEDHFWIHTQVHPLDGSAPQVPLSRIRWVSEYGEPNFGGMVTVHSRNSWQTPLAKLSLLAVEKGEGKPLPTYAPQGVPQNVWDEDRRLLDAMRVAHYGV